MLMQEYIKLKHQAWKAVEEGRSYHYRYGQSVWNLLPKEVSDKIYSTSYDFFYWPDTNAFEIDNICHRLCEDWVDKETSLLIEIGHSI
jgi:hypothetical protein